MGGRPEPEVAVQRASLGVRSICGRPVGCKQSPKVLTRGRALPSVSPMCSLSAAGPHGAELDRVPQYPRACEHGVKRWRARCRFTECCAITSFDATPQVSDPEQLGCSRWFTARIVPEAAPPGGRLQHLVRRGISPEGQLSSFSTVQRAQRGDAPAECETREGCHSLEHRSARTRGS